MVNNIIAVAIGAMGGAICRYLVSLYCKDMLGLFPAGTFIVNVTGSFAMGLVVTLVGNRGGNVSPTLITTITTGFLGSYTTFSSYELDTINLLENNFEQMAVFYWLTSPIAGFLGIKAGFILASLL